MNPMRAKVVLERLHWIETMLGNLRDLPLNSLEAFQAEPHIAAAAESYLRRALEALFDLGRHVLVKGMGKAPAEYKTIAVELESVGILSPAEAQRLRQMAGYRNRMVHFYHEISVAELYQICTTQLEDIEDVVSSIRHWLRAHLDLLDHTL